MNFLFQFFICIIGTILTAKYNTEHTNSNSSDRNKTLRSSINRKADKHKENNNVLTRNMSSNRKELYLSGMDIGDKHLTYIFLYRHTVEKIVLKSTSITCFPLEFFSQLSKLTSFILEENYYLESLPNCFYDLQHLKELKVDNNIISHIPKNFETIEALDLSNNRKLVWLKKLENFDVLKNLRSLDMSFNNLEELPSGSFDFEGVEHLKLSRNSLCCLPSVILNSNSLKILNLSKNSFTHLNKDFFSLFSKLEVLDVSHNLLTTFVNDNNSDWNELLTNSSQLSTIKELNLSKNMFCRSEEAFDNLKYFKNIEQLSVSKNQLGIFPSTILSLDKLTFLDVSHNLFEELPTVTDELSLLHTINLSLNHFTEVPITLSKLKSISVVDVSHNLINNLPQYKLDTVKDFDISHNKISGLENVEQLQNVKYLNLSNNVITNITTNLKKLFSLAILDVSNNYISEFPLFLDDMPSLKLLINYKNRQKKHTNYQNITVTNTRPFLKELKMPN